MVRCRGCVLHLWCLRVWRLGAVWISNSTSVRRPQKMNKKNIVWLEYSPDLSDVRQVQEKRRKTKSTLRKCMLHCLNKKKTSLVFYSKPSLKQCFVGLPGRCSTPTAALQFVKAWGGQKKSISMKIKHFSVVDTTLGCIEKPCKAWDKRPTLTVQQDFNKNRNFETIQVHSKDEFPVAASCLWQIVRHWLRGHEKHLSNEKNPGWLEYIGDYTT